MVIIREVTHHVVMLSDNIALDSSVTENNLDMPNHECRLLLSETRSG